MNRIIKFLSISALSLSLIFGSTSCSHEHPGDPAVGALLASFIQDQASGACAISLNYAGMWTGLIINSAIVGSSNTTGSTDSANFFDLVDYNDAAGTSATNLSTVSYNRKYDAFFTESTGWTLDNRNTALRYMRSVLNYRALMGGPAALCNSSATTTGTVLQAEFQTVYDSLSTEEQTDLSDNLSISSTTVAGLKALFTSCASITGDATIAANYTAAGGSTVAAQVWAQKRASKMGLLACANIPKSSCSVTALTSSSRAADLGSAQTTYNLISGKDECAKPGENYKSQLKRYLLAGTPSDLDISAYNFNSNDSTNEGGTTEFRYSFQSVTIANRIIATNAYPKFGTLVGLGFGNLMPMKSGTTAYDTTNTSSTFLRNGSNINATSVSTCADLGLTYNPFPGSGTRHTLTPATEVFYNFSANGGAAAVYDAITQTDSASRSTSTFTDSVGSKTYITTSIGDEVACNKAFREDTSLPEALIGTENYPQTLPEVNTTSGGPNKAAYLLSICYYGATSDSSGTADATAASAMTSIIASTSLGSGIAECSTAAKSAATQFSEMNSK
ncbi:MAG: hypothetical protein AAF518_07690 [Spirochaetota bacterium]